MIKPDILQQIKQDFNTSGGNSFLKVPDDEIEEFWKWFAQQSTVIDPAETLDSNIIEEGYEPNRCFGNAQYLFCRKGVSYFEGFVIAGLSFIHHGYNVSDNLVHDVTYYSNIEEFLKVNGKPLGPYYGIEIPVEFILKNKDSVDGKGYNTPLLYLAFWALKHKA